MTGTVLERSLRMVAQRLYKLRVLRRQALCWMLLLVPAIVLVTMLPELQGFIPTSLPVLLGVTVIGLAVSRWNVASPTAIETARLVEKSRPELNDVVLTAVQADVSARQQAHSSILNEWVIEEADKVARQSDWRSVIPTRQMFAWSTLSFLSFCFLVTGVVAAGRWGHENKSPQALLEAESVGQKEVVGQTELTVEPGDVELEKGTSLTVVARFGRVLPTDVVLHLTTEEGTATFSMEPTVDEGVFAGVVNNVSSDANYRVFFGSSPAALAAFVAAETEAKPTSSADGVGASKSFKVTTYVRPKLEQADALITPPAYTGKDEQLIEDTLRITAVEGASIQLTLHLNKPVAIAELRSEDGSVIPLISADPESADVMATVEAIDSLKYQV
ncbi:MAG: hypothetical protein WBH50_15655, partial [Fuerstiella sp.]